MMFKLLYNLHRLTLLCIVFRVHVNEADRCITVVWLLSVVVYTLFIVTGGNTYLAYLMFQR